MAPGRIELPHTRCKRVSLTTSLWGHIKCKINEIKNFMITNNREPYSLEQFPQILDLQQMLNL